MHPPTLLMVDDDLSSLFLLEKILAPLNLRIVKAHSGSEAIERCRTINDLALILLDVQMPGIDGIETARQLKSIENTQGVPIIFLTANQNFDQIKLGYEAGAIDYILKPSNLSILEKKVSLFIEFYLQKKQLQQKKQEAEEYLSVQNLISQNLLITTSELKDLNEQMRHDLKLAEEFQQAILPSFTETAFLKFSHRYIPLSGVSGDIYHISTTREGTVSVFLGDAVGHGITAAFLTMMARIILQNVRPTLPPAEVMRQINVLLAAIKTDKYMTGLYVQIQKDGLLHTSSAGHPPLVVIPANGGDLVLLKPQGCPLGMFFSETIPFEEESYLLHPGDRLLLLTDGLLECVNENGIMFGWKHLIPHIERNRHESLEGLLDILLTTSQNFSHDPRFEDDITMLAFQYQ